MSAIGTRTDRPEAVAAARKRLQELWRNSAGVAPEQNADFVDRIISRVLWEGGVGEAAAANLLRDEFGPRVAE
ncbi:MAG: hypothetical protein EOR86_13370 [Mesorhizobium sp.]|uniref:hypothetical protein n=1 Tax=Mesorhizobium sp. TaxID=1871066 RepID=UPI000FE91DAE|nr:hypothetical protein [Mesorhizobium sp.]RWM96193.1 MAG: hypothetical protein EOR86_13370 [Mesorhizobium sp.]